MKKLSMFSMVLLLLATGCSDEVVVEEEVVEDEVEEVVVEEEVVEEVEVEHVSDVEEEEEYDISRETRIELALMTLDDNMSAVGFIHYNEEEDIIEITPTDPEFTNELYLVVSGVVSPDSWNDMVESFIGLSESLTLLVDEDISLGLLNPENESRYILVINDGFILYNVVDEQ